MKASDPAFPISEDETDRINFGVQIYTGLTVRDFIAIKAMDVFCINCDRNRFESRKPKMIAEAAYKLADAMIEESNYG